MSELENYIYEFTQSLEQLNANIEFWLAQGTREHEELMRQIEEIRSNRDA